MIRSSICALFFFGILLPNLYAQEPALRRFPAMEATAYEKHTLLKQQSFYQSGASSWFDVTYYKLQLNVSTVENYLQGRITITGICRSDTLGPLVLDLVNRMKVDSTFVNGQRTAFNQGTSTVGVTLDRVYHTGEMLSIDVYYEGGPLATGFGSFEFDSHANEPWVYSLSEPSGARDWWPCKDDPVDKADSSDVFVTCDSTLKVGSNGILVSVVNNGDGTSTTHWQERYPIASYLISIALTNYAQFSNWFRYSPTDSMEVLNYVLPEHLTTALATLPKTVDMLSVYSNMFGLYPFIKEKYGHSEFGRGGAMEHQTMTSTTTFDEDVISHELAHQWFGDMITCRTWADLWLNEGFAQYCSGLFREKEYGMNSYRTYMNSQLSLAVGALGAIGVPDTSSVRNLFDGARLYNKGASVLHMLRRVLGDSVFFRSLRTYANSPALKYSTAAIRDFQTVCENVSGTNLEYFFREWIYGEGFPEYAYAWTSSSSGNDYLLTINIEQIFEKGNPPFFTMPIDFRITAAGWDTTVTVLNDSIIQGFVFRIPKRPSNVLLDPDGWILKTAFSNANVPPGQFALQQNYPNPFNPRTSITFRLPERSYVSLQVYDVVGRLVATIVDEQRSAGLYSVDWNSSNVASGVYFCRLTAHPQTGIHVGDFVQTRKMVLIK
jgi:aminopeptidase N